MAKFKIKSINYIVSGKTSRLVSFSYTKRSGSDIDDSSVDGAVPYTALADERNKNNTALGENQSAVQVFQNTAEIEAWKAAEKNRTTDNMTFVAGISRNMKYSPTNKTNDASNLYECNNVFSLYDKEDGTIIHPLFDIQDLCYKSYVQKYLDVDANADLSKQYIDIYAPQISNVVAFTQLSGSIFMLTDKVNNYIGMHKAAEEVNSTYGTEIQDIEYNFQITEDTLSTITYSNVSSNGSVSSIFDPKTAFIGLNYNCVIELPASFSYYNDFKNGNVFGNPIFCKNYYDALYSTELNSNKNALSSTREYIDTFTCGSKVYLKYYDTKNYSAQSSSNGTITIAPTARKTKCICQRIESIDKHSMYRNNIRHRTNMFSIEVKNTGLNELNATSKIEMLKQCIQQDIVNNIRNIAQRLSPANTQLFDVKIVS